MLYLKSVSVLSVVDTAVGILRAAAALQSMWSVAFD